MLFECEPECKYCFDNNIKPLKRFWSNVLEINGCWIWQGCVDPQGYGRFSYMSQSVYAHRFSLSSVEDLMYSLEIDHLCRNRKCVNPHHLEQVDHRTNMLRSPIAIASINANKTHCVNGHALRKQGRAYKRSCKTCISHRYETTDRSAYFRDYYLRNKAILTKSLE